MNPIYEHQPSKRWSYIYVTEITCHDMNILSNYYVDKRQYSVHGYELLSYPTFKHKLSNHHHFRNNRISEYDLQTTPIGPANHTNRTPQSTAVPAVMHTLCHLTLQRRQSMAWLKRPRHSAQTVGLDSILLHRNYDEPETGLLTVRLLHGYQRGIESAYLGRHSGSFTRQRCRHRFCSEVSGIC